MEYRRGVEAPPRLSMNGIAGVQQRPFTILLKTDAIVRLLTL
jgi:hypothetical protein